MRLSAYLRQLTGESFIYGLSGAASALAALFLIPLYTRVFSSAQFGVLDLVVTTMNVLTVIAVLALDNSAHRWYWGSSDEGDHRATLSTWAWSNIATTTLFALLILLLAPQLAQLITQNAANAPYFRLAGLTLPLGALGLVASGWLRMRRKPWLAVSFTIGTNLATVLLTILLVLGLRQGLTGVFMAQVLSSVLLTLVAAVLLGRAISPRFFSLPRLREMLDYALPLLPAALAAIVLTGAGRYFVQYYQDTAQVGLFGIGVRLASIALLVVTAFSTAWGPFALSIHQRPEARRVYAGVLLLYVWITGTLAAALAMFGPELLMLLTTPQYYSAWPVLAILPFAFALWGLRLIAAIGLNIVKDTKPIGLAITVSAVIFLGLSFMLVPTYGIVGASLASLASQALIPLYLFWRSQQLYSIPYNFGAAGVIMTVAAASAWMGTHLPAQLSISAAVAIKLALLLICLAAGMIVKLGSPQQLPQLELVEQQQD